MIDAIVCGVDPHREWMLNVILCDCTTGERSDFLWFFNTRSEAETRLEKFISDTKRKNAIAKIIKIRAFEHTVSDLEHIEKEN